MATQLERVFSVEHDLEASKDSLKDVCMAYGLLLRGSPPHKSSQYCETLCEEVSSYLLCQPRVCICGKGM